MDLHKLRKEYRDEPFSREDLPSAPFLLLQKWMGEALEADLTEPNAMVLATASKQGIPSARTVLLKQIEERGLVFYTHYGSRKSKEIEKNPSVSLVLCWVELQRQIVIQGRAEKFSQEESHLYFAKRPRGAQLEAWASPQGEIIPSREPLEERYHFFEKKFEGKEIPLPDHWGGILVVPETLEFWKGRENRLHDRFLYSRNGKKWEIDRLSP